MTLLAKRLSWVPFGRMPTLTSEMDKICTPKTCPKVHATDEPSTEQTGDVLITLGKAVCELTLMESLPIVPELMVDTESKNVAFAVRLTTGELDAIEHVIVFGFIVREPVLPKAVAPLLAWIEKLSE